VGRSRCPGRRQTVTVVSAYVFTGEDGTPKQDAKYAFLDAMTTRMPQLGPLAVITGDLNVGHRELDIRNWKGNVKKAGFLPRERAYFDRFLGAAGETVTGVDGSTGPGLGWVDVGRRWAGEVDGRTRGGRTAARPSTPTRAGASTTTSQRRRSPERVVDYRIVRAPSWDTRWSDHAPSSPTTRSDRGRRWPGPGIRSID
jgi:exodeoxyribonuclease-3